MIAYRVQDDPRQQKATIKWPHKLSKKQADFITSDKKFCLFSGGYGSGKTLAGCYKLLNYCINNPGSVCIAATLTYDQLKNTIIQTLLEIFEQLEVDILVSYNKSDKTMLLFNGSKIILRSCDDETKFRSYNIDYFYIDEATTIKESIWLQLLGRLRRKNIGAQFTKQAVITTNPANTNNWVYKFFYDANGDLLNKIKKIDSTYLDNKHLPSDYILAFKNYSQEYIDRYLMGKWGSLGEGLVYSCFSPEVHLGGFNDDVVPLNTYVSMDIGVKDPTVALFISIVKDTSGDNIVYVYDEYYQTQVQSFENIDKILAKIGDTKISGFFVDPSAADFKLQLRNRNINVLGTKNAILDGIQSTIALFNKNKIKIHPRCKNLIRELELYKWAQTAEGKPSKETPIDMDNHCLDALRYFCHTQFGQVTQRSIAHLVEAI